MIDDSVLWNDWYIVAAARDLDDETPLAVRVWDTELVVWRTGDSVMAWKDYCIHRGAKLSPGRVKDGNIVIDGPRAHLFYAGDVADANFKNFVFRAQVKTFPKANSGIYFHTKYQAKGWPDAGFEAQVNNTHGDPKKTGGLYAVKDVNPAPAKDGEWFNYEIRVKGKKIAIKINGKVTSSWTEVPNAPHLKSMPGRKLGSGTFALQAHDPQSVVHYRNIRVKPLK